MARVGDVIENPVFGDRLVFRHTTADSDGALLEFDIFVRAGATGPAEHVQPGAAEHFEVLRGTLRVRVAGIEREIRTGYALDIPAGTVHTWWNAGGEEAEVRVRLSPAGRIKTFLVTVYALARGGRTDKDGVPALLQLSVLAPAYFDTNHIVRPPLAVHRVVFGLLAPLARRLGYRPDTPYPYTDAAARTTR